MECCYYVELAMTYRLVAMTVILIHTAIGVKALDLQLTPVPSSVVLSGPQIKVEWLLSRTYSIYDLTWDQVTYLSQETYKEIGRITFGSDITNHLIETGLRYDTQYRVCLDAIEEVCSVSDKVCNYIKIPRQRKSKNASSPEIYIDIGPVHSNNFSVTWGIMPTDEGMYPTHGRGYQITWRRVYGRIDHPGHSSSIVSNTHTIRGLRPAARYEVCIGETIAGAQGTSCDIINTQESIPGPPSASVGSCKTQAHGTHWKCDVVWYPPSQPHGNIKKYRIEWRDQEGYDLMESRPTGALCDPTCYSEQIMSFHPYQVCVRAATNVGEGWESCVPIHDVSMRIVAFFELKIVLVIGITLLLYQLGPKILTIILRCCLRGLYRHVEGTKEHPV